jgi:hypothetical protein
MTFSSPRLLLGIIFALAAVRMKLRRDIDYKRVAGQGQLQPHIGMENQANFWVLTGVCRSMYEIWRTIGQELKWVHSSHLYGANLEILAHRCFCFPTASTRQSR